MDISTEIAAVQAASEGSELRQPLIDALAKINGGTLPAVTSADTGKILKVGANGWEIGEKSGYMPVPTNTKQITENGTYDVVDYASAVVQVPAGGITLQDEGKVVSNGTLVAQTARSSEITQNGTYDTTLNNSVTVNVSGSTGDVPLISSSLWDSLTTAQKREYGLVAIQHESIGYNRGLLVNGSDYVGIVQSGTGVLSSSFTVNSTGTYKLIVIAVNSEASSKALEVAATQNSSPLQFTSLKWNDYYGSGDNRRNYRIASFDLNAQANDSISIEVTQASSHTSLVWLLLDTNITTVLKTLSTPDGITQGAYTDNCYVFYGTFNNNVGGTVNLEYYRAGTMIETDNPGSGYRSSYIFWME